MMLWLGGDYVQNNQDRGSNVKTQSRPLKLKERRTLKTQVHYRPHEAVTTLQSPPLKCSVYPFFFLPLFVIMPR